MVALSFNMSLVVLPCTTRSTTWASTSRGRFLQVSPQSRYMRSGQVVEQVGLALLQLVVVGVMRLVRTQLLQVMS